MEKDTITPVEFQQQNVVYAANQPEYNPLPVHKTDEGVVTSCWSMSLFQRIKFLFTGKVYLSVWTFNQPLQPLRFTTRFELNVGTEEK